MRFLRSALALVLGLVIGSVMVSTGATVCTPLGLLTPHLNLCLPADGERNYGNAIRNNFTVLDTQFGSGGGFVAPGSNGQFLYNNAGTVAGSVNVTKNGSATQFSRQNPITYGDNSAALYIEQVPLNSSQESLYVYSEMMATGLGTAAGTLLQSNFGPTGGAITDVLNNLYVDGKFGYLNKASTGILNNMTSAVNVNGSGSGTSEVTTFAGGVSVNIGTGYTQTGAPTVRSWAVDMNLHGPIAVRPNLLNGITMFQNNYFNGNPGDSPGGGLWVVTKQGVGGFTDSTHFAADTFPQEVGIGVVGLSHHGGSDDIGWQAGIRVGGFGSGWMQSGVSRIATGLEINDWFSNGIKINDPHASSSGVRPALQTGNGMVVVGGTPPATYLSAAMFMTGVAYSTLSASQATNGTMIYCSDCTFASPCNSGGTGAFAKRLAGAWRCD